MSELNSLNYADLNNEDTEYYRQKFKTALTNKTILGQEYKKEDIDAQTILNKMGYEDTDITEKIEGINNSEEPLSEKIETILDFIDNLLQEKKAQIFDEDFHKIYESWLSKIKEGDPNTDFAGSWLSSLIQTVQLYAVTRMIKAEKVLRIGTASAYHAEQLVITLNAIKETRNNISLTVIDKNEAPLDHMKEHKDLFDNKVSELNLFKQNILDQNSEKTNKEVPNESQDLITSHFPWGSLPTKADFEEKNMQHEDALLLKIEAFEYVYNKLKEGGVLVTGVGTSNEDRRLNSPEEIRAVLENAGFDKEIFIYETSDPLDYDSKKKKHEKGNYFVVAIK